MVILKMTASNVRFTYDRETNQPVVEVTGPATATCMRQSDDGTEDFDNVLLDKCDTWDIGPLLSPPSGTLIPATPGAPALTEDEWHKARHAVAEITRDFLKKKKKEADTDG